MNTFNGFPKELIIFYYELEMNNSKAWFNEHRSEYEQIVKSNAEHFVCDMGDKPES